VSIVSSPTNKRLFPADFEVVLPTHAPLRGGEPVALRMSDGAILCGEWLRPSGPPVAVVALSHAMMVERRTLDAPEGAGLLSSLVAHGLQVLWFDQRGHGQSVGSAATGMRWDYDSLVADAGGIAAYLAEVEPQLPKLAVGHSLFGHVALAWQSVAMQDEAHWRASTDWGCLPATSGFVRRSPRAGGGWVSACRTVYCLQRHGHWAICRWCGWGWARSMSRCRILRRWAAG
jgi:predicted alpha/beta hydrolase